MDHPSAPPTADWSSTSTSAITAVPLPPRAKVIVDKVQARPVWSLESEGEKLLEGCGKPDGVCCNTQKEEMSRTLIDPDVMRDLVIGLADGLTVPFALTAGLSALGSTHLVVTGGVAELISGALSMGIGGFFASQADRDQFLYILKNTRERLRTSCTSELRREAHAILAPVGIEPKVSSAVADSLLRVERETVFTVPSRNFKGYMTGQVGNDPGLSTFLVRFGEGMEETTRLRTFTSGFTVGMGYLLGGIIPLLPYIICKDSVLTALWWSIGVTGITLLVFGSLKAWFTGAGKGAWGVTYGAVSTLAIGGAAAAASYGVVKALQKA